MLIQGMRKVRLSINVAPSEGIWEVIVANVRVRERRGVVVEDGVAFKDLQCDVVSIPW